MVKEIITDLEKLSERAEEIKDIRKENKEVQQIVLELKDTMRELKLPALAAPQIGYNKRIFVINFDGDLKSFVNPVIDYNDIKGMGMSIEQCPSIPGKKFLMIRNSQLGVMYMTPLGQAKGFKLQGMGAYTFQRMMNIIDGVLLPDMGLEVGDDFINASDEEKEPVVSAFLESLDLKQKTVEKEIDESPELSKIRDAANFINDVNEGKTHVIVEEEKLPEMKKEKSKKKVK